MRNRSVILDNGLNSIKPPPFAILVLFHLYPDQPTFFNLGLCRLFPIGILGET